MNLYLNMFLPRWNMIINFKDPTYLKTGNERQQQAYWTLKELELFETLASFDPVLTGTIPIEIDIPSSDLDVICEVKNELSFESLIRERYGSLPAFIIRKTQKQGRRTIIANFQYKTFDIEIFGQPLPVTKQMAYRHMIKEFEILQKKGPEFRQKVILLKEQGLSTEAAFAQLLGIQGDPYLKLLEYKC